MKKLFLSNKKLSNNNKNNEFEDLLKKYKLDKSKLKDNGNGTFNYNGDINLSNKNLKEIPLNFNVVTGDFLCDFNDLDSFNNCPNIVGKNFDCKKNPNIKSLEYCPNKIGGRATFTGLSITNLKHFPNEINGDLLIYLNKEDFSKQEIRNMCNVGGNIYNWKKLKNNDELKFVKRE